MFQNLQTTFKPMKNAESKLFDTPMILVDNTDGKTTCNHETLAELSKIEKTLNVVSVVGSLRTGKSFLLNKLAKVKSGFETGHTTEAVTKGIWVLCRPHPTQQDQVLVLLDTEGLDDPDKVEVREDQTLFILSTLLSSTMVYNTTGIFDMRTIEKFKFLRAFKSSVSVTGADTDDSILDFFCPNFVLTLRDFTSKIPEKTADVYLETKLKLKIGQTEKIRKFNEPRQLIRRYFKKRRCFIFIQPVKKRQLPQLMEIPESELRSEFLQTLNEFRDFIFSCGPKTLKSGKGINGRMLATLLTSYVTSIQAGNPPCLNEAAAKMADVENSRAVDKATKVYNKEMKKRITAHDVPDDCSLLSFHKDSMKAAIEVLKSELVIDDEQICEEKALGIFNELLRKFKSATDKNSRAKCLRRLETLNFRVIRKINQRVYCHPAGYDEYMTDINWIIKRYKKDAPYLGAKARETLQEFMDGKENEEEQVYEMVLEAQNEARMTSGHQKQRMSSFAASRWEGNSAEEEESKMIKAVEDEKIEDNVKQYIKQLQETSINSIGSQYLDILEMKVKESERVKSELSADDPYYEFLKKETEYLKGLYEKAIWILSRYKHKADLEPKSETSEDKKTDQGGSSTN